MPVEVLTISQLLHQAAQQSVDNATGLSDLRQTQQENAEQIAKNAEGIQELKQAQQENATQIKILTESMNEFVFQVNRLVINQQERIDRLDSIIERYDGVLSYLMRKDQERG